jgi:hypothetical protein
MGLCASSRLSTLAYLRTLLLLCSHLAELRRYSRRLFVQHQHVPEHGAAIAA